MTNEQPTSYADTAEFILHPTDFSEASNLALAHALRLAVSNKCRLDLLHVGKPEDGNEEFPSVRDLLIKWGMLAEHAPRLAVKQLGVDVGKIICKEGAVPSAIDNYCQHKPVDLIVLSTAGRHGLAAWLHPSTAGQIAKQVAQSSIPTLFVPEKCNGCVEPDTGKVVMEHVLVPVDHSPSAGKAVERALVALSRFGSAHADLTLLHVGKAENFPELHIPTGSAKVHRVARPGDPAAEILATAKEIDASAIIMVTAGTEGMLDVLRGSTTDQVLRHANCPLLAVPSF